MMNVLVNFISSLYLLHFRSLNVYQVYCAANALHCHNYCQLLQLLEVSFLLRKAATVSTPVSEISEVVTNNRKKIIPKENTYI